MNKKKLVWRILAALVALLVIILVALRLYLGSWVLDYVNNVLSHIPGYQGSVASIDIDLYRGAYRINKLVLKKDNGKIPTPFIAIDQTDISVQWDALLHGKVVSTISLIHPVINFAVDGAAKQTGEDVDWTQPIKKLTPVDINSVKFDDGSVTYQDFSSTPKVDIFIHKMSGEIQNLRNVQGTSETLPSPVTIRGVSIGKGNLKIDGRMNILKQVPDMDLKTSLENVDLPALNNYSEAYAAFDFKSGDFNIYSQLNVRNSKVSGYIKPIANKVSVDILKTNNPIEIVWSSFVAGVLEVFTNQSNDQFATKVDLDGNLGNIGTDSWSALIGILRNAYITAMSKGFDQREKDKLTAPQPQP